jgi:hypothetical protein
MFRRISIILSILLLIGGLRAASGTGDVQDNTEPVSNWVEGTRPVETEQPEAGRS